MSSWFKLSKKPLMSKSTAHGDRQHLFLAVWTASNADLLGLYPYESSWNFGSMLGSRYSLVTICATRSATVGMPSFLTCLFSPFSYTYCYSAGIYVLSSLSHNYYTKLSHSLIFHKHVCLRMEHKDHHNLNI